MVTRRLRDLNARKKSERGGRITPRFLASSYIREELADTIQMSALISLDNGYIGPFILLMDIAYGSITTASSVAVAEQAMRSKTDVMARGVVHLIRHARETSSVAASLDISEQAQVYLDTQKRASAMAEILRREPSGMELVNEYVKYLKGERNEISDNPGIGNHQIPELVIIGAELAQRTYKAVYPLAANLRK